jgi:hypothetical protein
MRVWLAGLLAGLQAGVAYCPTEELDPQDRTRSWSSDASDRLVRNRLYHVQISMPGHKIDRERKLRLKDSETDEAVQAPDDLTRDRSRNQK